MDGAEDSNNIESMNLICSKFFINDIRDWIIKFNNKYVYTRQTILYNRKVLENQSLDALNKGKGISCGVIIAKEKIALLPRTYVTIENVKHIVADLKKNLVVWFMHPKTKYLHIMDQSLMFMIIVRKLFFELRR